MILAKLFLCFSKIGAFAIGGAYSFLPLIEREVVDNYHWLSKKEFLDILGVVKVFPGAISIKFATYTGYKIAGIPGAIMANLGNLLVPVFLIIFITNIFIKYREVPAIKGAFNVIQLAVFAMIIAVAFQVVDVGRLIQLRSLIIVVVCFILFIYTKVHPALIITIAGIIGIFLK